MRRSLLCFTATISRLVNLTPCLLSVGPFPISSDLIASQLLLAIANCIPLSLQSGRCHPISSQLISSHVFSVFFTSSHLIPSHVFSSFLSSSQLIATVLSSLLMSPELFSSLLISSQLISAFSGFRSSSQRFSALSSSCQLILCLLISSLNLLTSPQLTSALVSSSHLISALLNALSYHLTSSLAQNLLQKRISAPTQATPALSTEKILHREACTHSKLLHGEAWHTEAFTQRQGSFYAQQVFTQSKLLHRASFYTEQAFTQKPFHREAFKRCKLWSTF